MSVVVMAILVLSLYLLFYRFYAKSMLVRRVCPAPYADASAHDFRDDVDKQYILFSHHDFSIVGLTLAAVVMLIYVLTDRVLMKSLLAIVNIRHEREAQTS